MFVPIWKLYAIFGGGIFIGLCAGLILAVYLGFIAEQDRLEDQLEDQLVRREAEELKERGVVHE